jgi:hypothetical protein
MTVLVLLGLLTLAFLDAAFAGFRSSAGRTGLIDHRAADFRAASRGIALLSLLLVPPAALALAGIGAHHAALAPFTPPGRRHRLRHSGRRGGPHRRAIR